MNLTDHLLKELQYNFWANRMLAEALIRQNFTTGRPYEVYCHVLASEMVWAARCMEWDEQFKTWEIYVPKDLKLTAIDNYNWLSGVLLETSPDLEKIISYKNSDGVPFKTPLHEILQHMLLHGQYHRGQVNSALRQAGLKPERVDYIVYQREGYKLFPQLISE